MKISTLFLLIYVAFNFSLKADALLSNKEHSKITFKVPYMQAFTVEGRFNDYLISAEKDDEIIKNIKGVIKVSSLTTFDKKRDSHLLKKDFFDESHFPIITIESIKNINLNDLVRPTTVPFKLKIKDSEQNVNFTLSYLGKRNDPWTKKNGLYFKGSATLSRKNFNISWNKLMDNGESFVVGDLVTIDFEFEFYKSNEKPAFSRFYKPLNVKKNFEVNLNNKQSRLSEGKKSNKSISRLTTENAEEYSKGSNIIVTLITGGICFLLLIVIGVFGQMYSVKICEKYGLNETLSYLLTSLVIMLLLIWLSIIAAPYMGYGVNPLLK